MCAAGPSDPAGSCKFILSLYPISSFHCVDFFSQLRVESMAPAYSLKKSRLPQAASSTHLPLSKPSVTHLIKDLEVDNPREELTLAQRCAALLLLHPLARSPHHIAWQVGFSASATSVADFRRMGSCRTKSSRSQRQRTSLPHLQRTVQT